MHSVGGQEPYEFGTQNIALKHAARPGDRHSFFRLENARADRAGDGDELACSSPENFERYSVVLESRLPDET